MFSYDFSLIGILRIALVVCGILVLSFTSYFFGVTTARCDNLTRQAGKWSMGRLSTGTDPDILSGLDTPSSKICESDVPYDIVRASSLLQNLTWPVSYEKTTLCETLHRACIMAGGDVILYDEKHQPIDGSYRPIETNITASLQKML